MYRTRSAQFRSSREAIDFTRSLFAPQFARLAIALLVFMSSVSAFGFCYPPLCPQLGPSPAGPPPGPPTVQAPGPMMIDGTADCLAGVLRGVALDNGTIAIGVNCEGHLNAPFSPDPLGYGVLGLRYMPTGFASLEPGCRCEGWGIANGCDPGDTQGYANEASGKANLIVELFEYTADTATSVVRVELPGSPAIFRVTHAYFPSPDTINLFEARVVIENISPDPQEVFYRRTLDWDAGPTYFSEFVTIEAGTTVDLMRTDTNGFNSGDPCSFTSYTVGPIAGEPPLIDAGPSDHGAVFDFRFYDDTAPLPPGGIREFSTFFGAGGTEVEANAALSAVGAEAYTFGQPNCPDPTRCPGTGSGPDLGEPNTFIYAFGRVGGIPLFCGNGTLDAGEECDDGNTDYGDGCRLDCTIEECGDGILDPGESCDDGNVDPEDGCRADCSVEVCGDGILDVGEVCDDGNRTAGDGCRVDCTPEICGDEILDPGEFCDDGNPDVGDGCRPDCTIERCGDTIVDPGEGCDDGNSDIGDGCRPDCTPEICGDGILDPLEDCDDGNTLPGDGCDAACAIELAVEYGSFFARDVPVGVVVEWTTINELHTAGFKVWALNADNTIEQIGFLFATGSHSHYAHMDDSAKAKAGLRRGYQIVEVTFEGDQGDTTPWFKITR